MNQQSAQGLASLGRGPDSMLVHMAPGEVKSLQQLAMAHGGSLTINPETGLPEAGFLSSLLPMIIGGGLTIASGGALSPLMAGMITGGGFGLATGSLKKGLMAGLGAYGGGSLGAGLAGAGGANLVAAGTPVPNPGAAMAAGAGDATANIGAAGAMNPANFVGPATPSAEFINPSNLAGSSSPGMFGNAGANFSKASAGAEGLLTAQGRNAFLATPAIGGGMGLAKAGLMAAAPMMMQTTTKQPEIKTDKDMGQRYQFNAGTQTPTPPPDVPGYGDQGRNFGKEQRYFNPSYTPIDSDAARKMYGFASGGPVEAMSDANSIGMNTGYPQADVEVGAYATPYQQPISRNVVTGPQGAGIDPYTGQQQRIAPAPQAQFADGGEVGYAYDPVTQMYTKKGGEGATMVSPIGGISGASAGGGDSYSPSGPPPTTTPEEFAAQSARNQQINDVLTSLAKNSLTSMVFSGLNTLFGSQPPANVESRGTSLGGGLGSPAAQGQTSSQSGEGNPGEQPGQTSSDTGVGNPGESAANEARGGLNFNGKYYPPEYAQGGISNLGDYSDGGRLLRGPGDGISDSIPATIGKKRPARLADGEFVVPARIVSELGNGSTEAGARKLYAMMDRVQKSRGKTVGKGKIATNSRAEKYLPA